MLFNSTIFVFVFLPITFVGYFGLRHIKQHSLAKAFLLLASLYFYAYFNLWYGLILIISIIGNYIAHRILYLEGKSDRFRKTVMIIAVSLNLLSIFYFKYYDFFIRNVNAVTKAGLPLLNIALPLGISFFTFQQISFVVDTYKYKAEKYSALDYSVYVAFFPQLIAGPIVLHSELIHQFSEETRYKIRADYMATGIRYFVIGLAKKTLLADRLSLAVTYGYENLYTINSFESLWLILAYSLQIYFDFSGYSDMAIGLGKMFGVDLPVNFDSPYKSKNIMEFWDKWHMTMTRFFTQYIYFPLGGSRKGKLRTYVNVMIVFALSGLWHGAGWHFVIWGCLHGAATVFHRVFKSKIERIPQGITKIVTFIYVNCAWVFFRAESFWASRMVFTRLIKVGECSLDISEEGLGMVKAFCGNSVVNQLEHFGMQHMGLLIGLLVITIIAMICMLVLVFVAPSSHEICNKQQLGRFDGIKYAFLAVMCVMTFSGVSEFIYFQF